MLPWLRIEMYHQTIFFISKKYITLQMLAFSILVLEATILCGIPGSSITMIGRFSGFFCPTWGCGLTSMALTDSGSMGLPQCCIIQEALMDFQVNLNKEKMSFCVFLSLPPSNKTKVNLTSAMRCCIQFIICRSNNLS